MRALLQASSSSPSLCVFAPPQNPPRPLGTAPPCRVSCCAGEKVAPAMATGGGVSLSSLDAGKKQHPMSVTAAKDEKAGSKEAKLWGGRFEESVTVAVERFSESVSFDKALYKHDIMGSFAHAQMLAAQFCGHAEKGFSVIKEQWQELTLNIECRAG